MQKLQDSVFSIVRTTSLSPAVFSYLQPTEDTDKTPLGGILSDTKYGWLALGPKFCVVDLRTGLKIAAWTFGTALSTTRISVTSVIELPTPLAVNTKQLIISLEYEGITGLVCVFHVNGSQVLRCIQTEAVVARLAICDQIPDGPFACFDGVVMAGTRNGEIFAFDLNRAGLVQALQHTSEGDEHLVHNELNMANITFLPLHAVPHIVDQRELAIENDDHLAVLLNENSSVDGQYIFHNPDGTIRMKAKTDHITVSTMQYIPQLGSIAVGFNFGAFQIWNLMTLRLEFTSSVNVECLPVTHFGFQEPCDDPRAFCYLWVVYSVLDRFEDKEYPLAVMYSLSYQGKRMLSDTKYLYQDFTSSTVRFQMELSTAEGRAGGARCVSCHTYCVSTTLGGEGEDSVLNICQLVWECWGGNGRCVTQYGMLLFDLDQWYKEQMPASHRLESSAFMSATSTRRVGVGGGGEHVTLDVRLAPGSVARYEHATRLDEHFYPNSLHYNCVCLSTSEASVLNTSGIQRQMISALVEVGGSALLNPGKMYAACVAAGLTPLYVDVHNAGQPTVDDQRRFLLSVALEARLSGFLKRCARDWATGTHAGVGCTLTFLVDWCWKRAIELKQNAKELTAPLFTSSAMPDRNMVRCLEHCVRQLTELSSLLDAILTKCCNMIVPDALSEIEEKYKGIGCVSLYFQAVQWFLGVGLLPERQDTHFALPYPAAALTDIYRKRRIKLRRLQDSSLSEREAATTSCPLLYIDQLIVHECDGDRTHEMWRRGGSESSGLYPPPSLYSLLRLYLLPNIAEQHKHSLVLYLLVDYSMLYDDIRYEAVIRRLMQFPTMFGLSNTAIKATQAFWHLDHRDFDFALDQLQCLTGNTLSEWQHQVVLTALLAQNKTQAALQYLHVRKPAPITDGTGRNKHRVNDNDKLDDWRPSCNLYLARGLVFEALDVIRMCVQNAASVEDKVHLLNYFFKACRNTGQLSKLLQTSLLPFEEQVFIRYLESSNEPQSSDILVMYYLQQARYLEAQQYNARLKTPRAPSRHNVSMSVESTVGSVSERGGARDTLVDVLCAALPDITERVARAATHHFDTQAHVIAPKPMSVFVQANTPKNTFTYKSSFIQETIENASETWMTKPRTARGLKRALYIEETPFLCTPKMTRTKCVFPELEMETDATPPKRPKLDLSGTPKTPNVSQSNLKVSEAVHEEMQTLLDMPEIQSPGVAPWGLMVDMERRFARETTPHSILKVRRSSRQAEAPSPVDSRYLGDTDDDDVTLDTASHTSDNKHLRFEIPTPSNPSESSTPSPPSASAAPLLEHRDVVREREISTSHERERDRITASREKDMDISSYATPAASIRSMRERHILESPPKKFATEENVQARKTYKDTVKARSSLSLSANSSLADDPNASIESIADIPITLINPRYSGDGRRYRYTPEKDTDIQRTIDNDAFEMSTPENDTDRQPSSRIIDNDAFEIYTSENESHRQPSSRSNDVFEISTPENDTNRQQPSKTVDNDSFEIYTSDLDEEETEVIRIEDSAVHGGRLSASEHSRRFSPAGRRSIRRVVDTTAPLVRSRSTPLDRQDSPIAAHTRVLRSNRNKSGTPEPRPPPPLDAIAEQPRLEVDSEPHAIRTTLSAPTGRLRTLSSRSRSRTPDRMLKVIESPSLGANTESPTKQPPGAPSHTSTRSRSRTPEPVPSQEVVETTQLAAGVTVISSSPSKRTLRSRSKTPDREKVITPSEKPKTTRKSLSRMVLEHNAFAKAKPASTENIETDLDTTPENVTLKDDSGTNIECTPKKCNNPNVDTLMDVEFSPITNKSVLQSPDDSFEVEHKTSDISTKSVALKSLAGFSITDSYIEKSVLVSYKSSIADNAETTTEEELHISKEVKYIKEPSRDISSISSKSVLKDVSSLMTSDSDAEMTAHSNAKETEQDKHEQARKEIDDKIRENAKTIQKEKERIVEIEREINEIEDDISEDRSGSEAGIVGSESDDELVQDSGASDDDVDDEVGSEEESSEDNGADFSADNTSEEENDEENVISIADSSEDEEKSSSSEGKLQIDEQTNPESNIAQLSTDTAENTKKIVEIQIEEEKGKEPAEDQTKNKIELEEGSTVDPLNQADLSILTDDNSMLSMSEQSALTLIYSNVDKTTKAIDELENNEMEGKIKDIKEDTAKNIEEKADIGADNESQRKPQMEIEVAVEIIQTEIVQAEEPKPSLTEPADQTAPDVNIDEVDAAITIPVNSVPTEPSQDIPPPETTKPERMETSENQKKDKPGPKSRKRTASASSSKPLKETAEKTDNVTSEDSNATSKKPTPSTSVQQPIKESDNIDETIKTTDRKPALRKRASSTASNKSAKEAETTVVEETPKTPTTRKRAISTSFNKSEIEATPVTLEQKEESSRRRAKTPTSTEVRRILTRRASKELSESKLMDESQEMDESLSLTPRRRSARIRSRNIDDNASVASGSSVISTRSKASEDDAKEVKAAPVRKARRSVLMPKPELSVIPELSTDELHSNVDGEPSEYSTSRRLTRHQKAVLASGRSASRTPTPQRAGAARRRSGSLADSADDDASSTASSHFDRIDLLNKTDFEGTPDAEELHNITPADSSFISDYSSARRRPLVRAASESKSSPKPKPLRRLSVDIGDAGGTSPRGSSAGSDVTLSPGRARRACFARACEALSTPKGRRASADVKTESGGGSPAPSEPDASVTPARRSRRASSARSNTSMTNPATSGR